MGDGTALLNGSFATSNTFKQAHSLLQRFVRRDIDQVRAGHTMLCDQDRLAIALELGQQFRGLALKSGHKFGTHEVILKYHFSDCKWWTRPNYN